ncbi:MAG TPA: flagellar basal-body MS-ring/collar protein FliF [Gammaproteobacteria bacterium]
MADAALPQSVARPLAALGALPVQRQLGLVLGLAMAVAAAVSLALWGLRPSYQPLLPGLAERDIVQAMNVLTREGIEHRIDPDTGVLMVPATKMHEARIQLATEGLPRAAGVGFELLDQQPAIGSSRMAEAARYQRALEGELARSVMALDSVESARVHLALPRDSVFVRDRAKPAASVLVNLHPGRTLDDRQVAGIVHLLASSVPELTPERVTVVDQRGRLLSSPEDGQGIAPARQLAYTRELEEALRRRVQDILSPLVGPESLRVQVTAEVDFTHVESTREAYGPDSAVVRSEQSTEEQTTGAATGGVPGALSNQPPDGATIVPGVRLAEATEAESEGGAEPLPVTRSRSSTRNYEIDRTISHVRESPATLKRLSVAVVVDDEEVVDEAGNRVRRPRSAEQMAHFTSLVREAVGFNEARGDSVNVVNASFREMEQPEEAADPYEWWQTPFVRDLIRQGLAGLGVLIVLLCVLRPALKALARPPVELAPPPALVPPDGAQQPGELPGAASAPAPRTLEGSLEQARRLTQEDPRRVAQVVRQWMQADEK